MNVHYQTQIDNNTTLDKLDKQLKAIAQVSEFENKPSDDISAHPLQVTNFLTETEKYTISANKEASVCCPRCGFNMACCKQREIKTEKDNMYTLLNKILDRNGETKTTIKNNISNNLKEESHSQKKKEIQKRKRSKQKKSCLKIKKKKLMISEFNDFMEIADFRIANVESSESNGSANNKKKKKRKYSNSVATKEGYYAEYDEKMDMLFSND